MKTISIFGVLVMGVMTSMAQTFNGKISGNIRGVSGSIPGATIRLQQAGDTIKKYTVSDGKGNFSFPDLSYGHYLLSIMAISYQPEKDLPVSIDGMHQAVDLPVIVLRSAAVKSLKEVVITSSKPLIEHGIDRTIINVSAMLSASASNGLEVLSKSPGVYVDPDGNISLNGRGGVLVLVDDKPTYLAAQDLAAYLRSLPGGSLDQIELMTNPPSKYEAAGSAIINIKLKKSRAAGFNGNISVGFNAGEYLRSSDALNINYRRGKVNVFANVSYTRDANFTQNNSIRTFYQAGAMADSSLSVNSRYAYLSNGWNLRSGVDYYATPNTTIGVMLMGGLKPFSGTTTFRADQRVEGVDSLSNGMASDYLHFYNGGIDLNFQHQFDQSGQSLSADLDHIRYHTNDDQHSANTNKTGTSRMQYQLPSDIQIYSAKTDYTLPLGPGARFEAGLKSSWVTTDNNDLWFDDKNGAFMPDYTRSDHFRYRENINAIYVSAQKQWKRWGIKAGLRLENTQDNGHQLPNPAITDSSFHKNYNSMFPSFYLSYKLDTTGSSTLGFMYSRRLHRPNYQQLNPYLAYQNGYTYAAGNPYLIPNFYQILEVSYHYKQFFDLSVAYIGNRGNIYNITSLSGKIFITRPENFSTNNSYNLHADFNVTPVKGWDMNAGGLIFHLINKGEGYGTYINDAVTTGEIELDNSFHLGKNWSAELNGSYHGAFHGGQTISGASWVYNIAIERKLFIGNGSIRLRADNLFHTVVFKSTSIGINNVATYSLQQSDTSLAGLSFQYSFGKSANARKRSHTIGAEDEQGRTN